MVGTTLTPRERRFYDQLLAPYLAAHKSGMYFTLRDLLRYADQNTPPPTLQLCGWYGVLLARMAKNGLYWGFYRVPNNTPALYRIR